MRVGALADLGRALEAHRVTLAKLTMLVLALGAFFSANQTLFCIWMTAHPLYSSPVWVARFYLRFATTVTLCTLMILLGVWMRRNRTSQKDQPHRDQF
jgi:hypothetical protein